MMIAVVELPVCRPCQLHACQRCFPTMPNHLAKASASSFPAVCWMVTSKQRRLVWYIGATCHSDMR